MGARSRKRRRVAEGAARAPRVRGEARNEQIRAGLVPLRPGERPRVVQIAVAVAVLVALANVVLYLSGYSIQGQEDPTPGGAFGVAGLLLVTAAGMWWMKYWAVLGFQCLLAITAVFGALALLVSSNLRAAVLSLAVVAASGALFWRLVRVLSRIQMPQRPARGD